MTRLVLWLTVLAGQDDLPQVPEGWTVERVAGAPLVERPVMASFDERGRLYVIDSAGVNLKGSELAKNPPHRIRRLEDSDGDGRFDRSVVFADKLVFPQGLLWHDGALYTTSPPGFWKLEDTDGDGVCDRRTELLTGFANTGVADDAHGACLGPDGRLYFLPGRMAHKLHTPDGKLIKQATGPWLMRMRPDGSDIEIVCGSPGNPVEVDWRPEGDFFISGTFWAPESFGGGLRDALIHGVEGGEYPVRDRVYNDRKRTGDLLPVLVPMIATAPSGMLIVRGNGPLRGDLLCTYFNTHRVQRHVLERDGATFRAKTEEFVSSAHPDFHPTDVLEDADGSFLVIDTGGWFRIGCPTSQVAKPEVLGGIYRVRRKDAPAIADARGLKSAESDPVLLFDDPRWAVREEAVIRAARRGTQGLEPALKHPKPQVRLNAVWAACRIEGEAARKLVRSALEDGDAGVRQAAATAAGLHRDVLAVPVLSRLVTSDVPPVRREAAAALGRCGRGTAALLDSLRAGTDRFLEHAVIFALLRIADTESLLAALKDSSASVRRAALIALDQIEPSPLSPDLVSPLLDPVDAALQQTAFKVIASRPAWSREIQSLARQWLGEADPEAVRAEILRGVVVSFARESSFQDLIAHLLRDPRTPVSSRLILLESMPRTTLERLPSTWLAEARWSLDHPDVRVQRQAVAVLRQAGTSDFDAQLLVLAKDETRALELRVEILGALVPRLVRLEGGSFAFLRAALDRERPPLQRLSAAEVLGRGPLDDAQLDRLTADLPGAGPLELPRLVGAYERARGAGTVKKFLESLEKAPALSSIPAESLRRVIKPYPELKERAAGLLKQLEVDTELMRKRLVELDPVLRGGDAARGKEVFFGRKAGCTACHRVQEQGAKVGPDLSKIGSIRQGRDLLEAIVFPSATFARGFESILIRTREGAVLDGMLARETPEAIVLFAADRSERRVPKTAIEEMRESRVSVMPQGLDVQMGTEDLRDLIAWLMTLK